MKERVKSIREALKDPKKKSLTLLIIYIIFFIFVFSYINTHNYNSKPLPNNDKKIDKNEPNIDKIDSYEYAYDININDEIVKIDGTYYNNQEVFLLNDIKYVLQDNKIYLFDDNSLVDNIKYPLTKLNYNSLKTFIKSFEYESKTEYKDKNTKYQYLINNGDMSKYLENEGVTEGNTIFTIYEDDYIYEIDIDLSKYYNVDKYLISIKYSNINNITNLDINGNDNKAEDI